MPMFEAPEGVQIPEDLKKGDEFEALASFAWEGERKLILRKIDGHVIAGYEKKGESEPDEDMESKVEKAYADREAGAY